MLLGCVELVCVKISPSVILYRKVPPGICRGL